MAQANDQYQSEPLQSELDREPPQAPAGVATIAAYRLGNLGILLIGLGGFLWILGIGEILAVEQFGFLAFIALAAASQTAFDMAKFLQAGGQPARPIWTYLLGSAGVAVIVVLAMVGLAEQITTLTGGRRLAKILCGVPIIIVVVWMSRGLEMSQSRRWSTPLRKFFSR